MGWGRALRLRFIRVPFHRNGATFRNGDACRNGATFRIGATCGNGDTLRWQIGTRWRGGRHGGEGTVMGIDPLDGCQFSDRAFPGKSKMRGTAECRFLSFLGRLGMLGSQLLVFSFRLSTLNPRNTAKTLRSQRDAKYGFGWKRNAEMRRTQSLARRRAGFSFLLSAFSFQLSAFCFQLSAFSNRKSAVKGWFWDQRFGVPAGELASFLAWLMAWPRPGRPSKPVVL